MHMAPQLLANPRARHTTRHPRSRQDSVHKTRVKVQGSSQAGQQHLSAAPGTTSSTTSPRRSLTAPLSRICSLPTCTAAASACQLAPMLPTAPAGMQAVAQLQQQQTWTVLGPRIQRAIARMVRSSLCSSCGLDRMSNAKESSILPEMTPPKFL